MRRSIRSTGLFCAAAAVVATSFAQPPEGPPPDGPPPPFRDPLRRTLDANHDMEIDADEIAKAPTALATLDKNGDGKIDREELRPPMGPPPGGSGRGPGDRGPRDGGDRPGPERFVERATEFDADGDGKLDKDELRKLGEAMAERMRAGRGTGGPPRDRGDRPERPRPPE